jgi:hypothetical protein
MIASDAVTGPSQSDTTALVSKVRGSTSAEIGCWPAPEHRRTETPDVDHKSAWPGGMRHNLELCYSHRRNRSGLPNSAVLDQGGGAPRRCGPPRMFAVQHPQRPATGSYADLSARSLATRASMSSRAWCERIGSM